VRRWRWGRRKKRETSMLGPCDRHGGKEWSWDLRLNEYPADEREKEREREREREREVRKKEMKRL